jgi:hypothetical protein
MKGGVALVPRNAKRVEATSGLGDPFLFEYGVEMAYS